MATEVSHKSYGPLVPYTYFGNGTASSTIGMDGLDGNKLKISALATPNVNPTTVNQISIDPAANGNIVLNPNGSGTVNIDYATQYTVALYGASGALQAVSGTGTATQLLTSNGAGANPSWQNAPAVPSGGYTWNIATGATNLVTKNGYISESNGGTITYTLPSAPTLGDSFIVTLGRFYTGGKWRITQNAGDTIWFGDQKTTQTTGYLESTGYSDTVEIVAYRSSEGWLWIVLSSIGNITVV